ncbi:MAG: Panacea domain-containing protein [Muribaculum sp.]|nr:Panacea domain-containing protein [Muribaculum sp.]
MKLHKLLYLTQRECLIQYDKAIVGEVFEAWKYGPVAPEIRHLYKESLLDEHISEMELAPYREAIDYVFEHYAPRNSWSLSSITHGEYAWQNAYSKFQGHVMSTEDISKDASRIRLRRFLMK